jgi:hypothetical protein
MTQTQALVQHKGTSDNVAKAKMIDLTLDRDVVV